MKKLFGLPGLFILSFVIFGFVKRSAAVDEEWVELINGKDMTGWKPATENSTTWTVTPEGYLQAHGKRCHLFYEGPQLKDGFKNFEIEVQVRTFKLANSGIYIHTEYQAVGWPGKGIEIQVNNTHIGEADFIELKKTASLYGTRNIFKTFGKDGEWMTMKARVESNHVQIWLNGVQTVDYIQPDKVLRGRPLSKGTFGLQGHDSLSRVQYRSFKVRRLPDDVRSEITPVAYGAWHDSLMAMQGRQFAFIDLNPSTISTAKELTAYVYATGINASLVKEPQAVGELSAAKGLPIFTGIKVTAANQSAANISAADYIVGESTDVSTARALLSGGKINIWSDKGGSLRGNAAGELLDKAKQNNIAIEIDNLLKYPSVEILRLAKSKGCKFTFAGLIPATAMQESTYIMTAIKEADINYKDLYIPKW